MVLLNEGFPIIGNWLVWKIANGVKVGVGEDPWLRGNECFRISQYLAIKLNEQGTKSLISSSTQVVERNVLQGWKSIDYLGLQGYLEEEWNTFLKCLNSSDIKLSDENDTIIWPQNASSGNVIAKLGYQLVVLSGVNVEHKWWNG